MRAFRHAAFHLFLGAMLLASSPAAGVALLHHFVPDGLGPKGELIPDGAGFLYGTSDRGGLYNGGVIFRIREDGSDYAVLHHFGRSPDGTQPGAGLVLDAWGNLFGTTRQRAGATNPGTIFTMRTDGSGYTTLHTFAAPVPTEGGDPQAALVVDASGVYLYGTTTTGGSGGQGTLFRMQTDGGAFTVLHSFAGGTTDGAVPMGLAFDGTNVFGVTTFGGASGSGTFYSMKVVGAPVFTLVHSFQGGASDGALPSGAPTVGAAYVYGTTAIGGSSNAGTVFRVRPDGTEYEVLHTLIASEGTAPFAGLTLDGLALFGVASQGGSAGFGTLFTLQADGTGFSVLHHFTGTEAGGRNPAASLCLLGSRLLGSTVGTSGSVEGTLFSVATDGGLFMPLHLFRADGASSEAGLVADGSGTLYGTTYGGGATGHGTVFKVGSDGTGYSILKTFDAVEGANPGARLVLVGTTLFGTTGNGGSAGSGTLFRIGVDGSGFAIVHHFTGGAGGSAPTGLLFDGIDTLYGTTVFGGTGGRGTVYKIYTDGAGYTILHSFSGAPADGAAPNPQLIRDATGNLWGTTNAGGTGDNGTVFQVTPSGSGYWVIRSLGGAEGAYPLAGLVSSDLINFYGTTSYSSTYGSGSVFRVDAGSISVLRAFAAEDGRPGTLLLASDGFLYGTTDQGGASGYGTVFRLFTDGSSYGPLHTFGGAPLDGSAPLDGVVAIGTELYGTTSTGGVSGGGTVFRLPRGGTCSETATASGNEWTCAGGSAIVQAALTGTGPWSLTWSDGVVQTAFSSPAIRVVSPAVTTAYHVALVTGAAGCSGTTNGEALVRVRPVPAAPSVGHIAPVCEGGPLNLFASGVVGASYSWSGPNGWVSSDQNPVIASAATADSGTYYAVATADGCSSPAGSTVVSVVPDSTPPVVTAPSPVTVDQSLCCGAFGGATGLTSAPLAAFLGGASAIDGCDLSPAPLMSQVGGLAIDSATCFSAGATTVTFRFQDLGGRIGTASSDLTVRMFGDLNLDQMVDGSDYVILRDYLNFVAVPEVAPFNAPLGLADLNHDATVDPGDFVMIRDYMNFVTPCLAP